MDYESLSGKEVKIIVDSFTIIEGIVVAVEPDVGISIVRKDDSSQFLMCFKMPLAPNFMTDGMPERNAKFFHVLVDAIVKGELDAPKLGVIYEDMAYGNSELAFEYSTAGNSPNRGSCPFGQ